MKTDLEAIEDLRRRGADLSLEHDFFNYFLCWDEDSARHLTNWIVVWGYEASVIWPRGTHGWEVRAKVTIEPCESNVLTLRDEMEAMARRTGARYEGWEVEEIRRTM
jgi:Regulator of ribonuclease activity B